MTTLLMIVVMAVGVIVNIAFENAFEVVASLATFATVFVWVMILLAHIAYKRGGYEDEVQPVRLPLVVSYITLAFMAFIVVLFGFFDDTRLALVVGAIWCVFLLAYYRLAVAPRLAKNAKLAIASDAQGRINAVLRAEMLGLNTECAAAVIFQNP